jgi:diguanylate cyclase (GGDEF)-like protein
MTLDCLTGLYSRVGLFPQLNAEIERYTLDKTPFCMAWADVDNLKPVNDSYGHSVGNTILKDLAQILIKETSPSGLVYRYGGDNFPLILPGCGLLEGIAISERIRKTVDEHIFDQDLHITVSIGVDEYRGGSMDDFFNGVDDYIYKAKSQGRNRVCHREI